MKLFRMVGNRGGFFIASLLSALGGGGGGSDTLLGRDPGIITQKTEDQLKQDVANPLAEFLAKDIGKGIPRYDGRITGDYDQASKDRFNEFQGIDSETFFNERIRDPAVQTFKEDLLPVTREQFAGSLSSSNRFRTEEEAVSKFTRGLAETRANVELTLPQIQFQMATVMKQQNDKEAGAQYEDWLKSLPQFNPTLERSLQFLNKNTSTGTDVLAFLDQGSEGILGDIISGAATVGAGAFAACWPSAEIFGGWMHPKTCRVRLYINAYAPMWLTKAYRRYGPWIAGWLADNPLMKKLVRPLFEYWAYRGGKECPSLI